MNGIDPDLSARSYHDFGALGRLKAEAGQDPSKALKETATQFEAYFLQQMMKSMRDTIDKSDLVERGSVDFYEEMMDKEVAMLMAKRGSLGLSQVVSAQMARSQPSTQDALKQRPEAMPLHAAPPALPLHRTETWVMPSPAQKAYDLPVKTEVKP